MKTKKAKIYYLNPFDEQDTKESKLEFLKQNKFKNLQFDLIIPDERNNWLNQSDNDWDSLLPMGTKECKGNKKENAIFKLFSLGVVTNRDEWVYDFDKNNLESKVKFFVDEYNKNIESCKNFKTIEEIHDFLYKNRIIKYTSELEANIKNRNLLEFSNYRIYKSLYRPFINKYTYFDKIITHRQYQQQNIFPTSESENIAICISGTSHSKPFQTLIVNKLLCLDFLEKTQSFPLYTYKENQRIDNITEFGLNAFKSHYRDDSITKRDIFNYSYAVLHSSKYRAKYEINLKQDLPRIGFYEPFKEIAEIGGRLIAIHTDFETIEPYPLKEIELESSKVNKPKLKLSNDKSEILIDEVTILTEFPKEALDYKLGNRSAVEWVLDGYKEKKIQDPTVAKMFDNYKFENYKSEVIELLKRVTNVSLKTIELIKELDCKIEL